MKPLEEVWTELLDRPEAERPVHQRVDDIHPVDFYAAISSDGRRSLFLVSPSKPPHVENYHAFHVNRARRRDGRWALSVELVRPEFARIFAHLCEDLIETARENCSPESAAGFVVDRIIRWQKLLGRDRSQVMDDAAIRGLIGELLFIKYITLEKYGPDFSMRCWEGPLDAPQDFRLPEKFAEVKTCGPRNLVVWVTSAEQLDVGDVPIVLSTAIIEPGTDTEEGAFSLRKLVSELETALTGHDQALQSLSAKLALVGYSDRDEYDQNWFSFRRFRHFRIAPEFPSVRRSRISDSVVQVRYQLDLATCGGFELETFHVP